MGPPGMQSKQPAEPESEHKQSPDDSKKDWRTALNRSMKRLYQDYEFAGDQRLQAHKNQLRCNHVDSMHEWYMKFHDKKNSKEAESLGFQRSAHSPAFLRF